MSRHLDYWSNLERSNYKLWLGFWAMTGLALLEAWQPRPTASRAYRTGRGRAQSVPAWRRGWSWWRRITRNATC